MLVNAYESWKSFFYFIFITFYCNGTLVWFIWCHFLCRMTRCVHVIHIHLSLELICVYARWQRMCIFIICYWRERPLPAVQSNEPVRWLHVCLCACDDGNDDRPNSVHSLGPSHGPSWTMHEGKRLPLPAANKSVPKWIELNCNEQKKERTKQVEPRQVKPEQASLM